ncbi:LOW QUALITY PROTEIN: ubiquitin carboxyl-terminal hydrolase 20 [Drosophila tropicalis]|uniref:LOW QUALITY PROTEIN: ubiquitin carboxyl-terminal hydrolase 20 n=1 Tax=Drosophila tropicalis TaxID=46794 RepID=UPI0035AC28AE
MNVSFSPPCPHSETNHKTVDKEQRLPPETSDSDNDLEREENMLKCHDELFSYSLNSLAKRDEYLENVATGSGTGLVGLQNLANTCYMNSALQALSNLNPMTHYFINCGDLVEHIADQSSSRCKPVGLAKSYQRLMQDIWLHCDDPKEFVAPRGILYGIRSVHPMFRGYQQHDTQEFLRCFMDQLHEELTEQIQQHQVKTDEKPDTNEEEGDHVSGTLHTPTASESEYDTCESSMSESSGEVLMKTEYFMAPKIRSHKNSTSQSMPPAAAASPTVESARSIISDVFDGKLLSSVQCLTCDRISTREETFQDLSLPIPTRDFLNVLHQTHSLSVQSLNATDANEGWISWMLGLLRSWIYGPSVTLYDCMASFFSADELKGDNMYSCEKCNKLRTGIKYSRVLNLPEVLCIHLKRFRHDLSYSSKISSHVFFPLEGFDMHPYVDKNCQSQVYSYNLSSVICHHGTVGGGHYTCYARNTLNGRWYEFDDQFVNEVSSDVVQNCQAYVLFYQKHNPQMKLVREEALSLSSMYPLCHSDIQFYVTRKWLTRLATFSEPGPINNREILCPHGGILHSKADLISQIAVPISQPLWDYLFKIFGGGPAVNILFQCEACKRVAECLARRQLYELNEFTKYNGLQSEHLDSSAIYAIAMPWLRSWQQFSRGKTQKEPGPITNEGIAHPSDNTTSTISCVRSGADFAQLNARLWHFLHGIYGGGPEILLRRALSDDDEADEIEIIDQDDETDEPEPDVEADVDEELHNAVNHSDTESTMGRHFSPSTSPSPVELPATSPLKTKRNRSNLKVSALRLNMRKRGRRNRNAFKQHAEMYGAEGNYHAHDPPLPADGSVANAVEQRIAFDHSITRPFQKDNFQVNGRREKISRDKSRSISATTNNNNKENVTLQKFVTLRESNGVNDETDI